MISQILIGLFGVAGIWLSQQSNDDLKKYASICGLLGQPFWFYAMYEAQQWGVFVMCFFYTWSWGLGFYNYWLKGKTLNSFQTKMSHELQEGVEISSVYITLDDVIEVGQKKVGVSSAGNSYNFSVDSIKVSMQPGQMGLIPWALVESSNGESSLFNLANCAAVDFKKVADNG